MVKSSATNGLDKYIKDDGMISAWSHSRLSVFESCKFRAKLQCIDRIPEPDRGPPPRNLKEWPNDRGARIHDEAEQFVRGQSPFARELEPFRTEFDKLVELFKAGKVLMEDMWCFDNAWQVCGPRQFDRIWVRIKLDALVFLTPSEAIAVDYKTGKRYGNEVKHAEQMQLYALGTFLRYPKLERVTTELWYTDLDELADLSFTRQQSLRFLKNFNKRGINMTQCRQFPPNPNAHSCKWCPYGPAGTAHCEVGIQ